MYLVEQVNKFVLGSRVALFGYRLSWKMKRLFDVRMAPFRYQSDIASAVASAIVINHQSCAFEKIGGILPKMYK